MVIPKVSIICICYNQKSYLEEAIESAVNQNYANLEVIVVDDCSADGSQDLLASLKIKHPDLQIILNKENSGNCVSFNKGFAQSTGEYIIDLAADDILLPHRVSTGVADLSAEQGDFGVHYSDHEWIDPIGKSLGYQYDKDPQGNLINPSPSGDIYADILERYFISAPTMMIRREVLDQLDGYDELLTYEDFDFWVRSSRNWRYYFSDKVLVKKRVVEGSLSSSQFRFGSRHDRSTYLVCQKALKLNRNAIEHNALKRRLSYERKHALANGNLKLAKDYHDLIGEVVKQIKDL